jgi:hypothetical protein
VEVEDRTAHVQLRGLSLVTPAGEKLDELFLPIDVDALRASVTECVTEQEDSAVLEATRKRWAHLHDTRGQGAFTISLSELLDQLADAKVEEPEGNEDGK